MGQLIVKFNKGNPGKKQLRFVLTLPERIEDELQRPKEVVINGIQFVKKSKSTKKY
jgi:hypothetical protein